MDLSGAESLQGPDRARALYRADVGFKRARARDQAHPAQELLRRSAGLGGEPHRRGRKRALARRVGKRRRARAHHGTCLPVRAALARRARVPASPRLRRARLLFLQARVCGELRRPERALRIAALVGDADLSPAARQRPGLHRRGARGHHRRALLRRASRALRAAPQGGLQLLMDARWPVFLFAPAALTVPAAHATVYLSVEQAQQAFFAGASFTPVERAGRERLWHVSSGGWFFVDQVLGQPGALPYAVPLGAGGAVAGIEVPQFPKAHGGEVRNASW